MKRLALTIALTAIGLSAFAQEKAFVETLQQRDSILIADQLRYGVNLAQLPAGSSIALPQVKDTLCRDIEIVSGWQFDTLKTYKKTGLQDIRASLVITSFDEGEYLLPGFQVAVLKPDGNVDTLTFEGQDVLICTMPVDTASFKIHDLKVQMRYPVTFTELLPWIGGTLLLAAAIFGLVWYLKRRKRLQEEAARHDPPHIVALRKLDAWRGDKHWAPAKQKAFYSGVTDALREYICARYGVSAMEMTTAEMFNALKKSDFPEEFKMTLRELFERSDYVKFAKYVASDEENAQVLPLSVRFVTDTYKEEIEGENNVL